MDMYGSRPEVAKLVAHCGDGGDARQTFFDTFTAVTSLALPPCWHGHIARSSAQGVYPVRTP